MCKVSIIMPVYNKVNYIDKAIKSILEQTFSDWELIIVNDGSTDDSDKIIEKYVRQDIRLHYISQSNRGVSVARNEGLKKASGEWVWFVDADDIPDKEFISNVFSIEYDKEINIIVGSYECMESNCLTQKIAIEEQGRISAEKFPELFMKYQYSIGFWGYLWNKLLRREFVENVGCCFKEGLTLAEDLKFMVELYCKGAIVYSVSYNAMNYTIDATNSSREKKIDYREQLLLQVEIKNWIVDYCNKVECIDYFKKVISNYVAFNIFYGFEEGQDCVELATKLLDDIDVNSQLDTRDIEKTMFPIVWCLIHKNYVLLKSYLNIRKIVRNIYRFLSKKD